MKKVFTKKFSAFIIALMLFSASVSAQWGINGTNIFNSLGGNVGIGTSSPVAKLHVEIGASSTTALRLSGTNVRMTMNNSTFQTLSSGNNLSINAKTANIGAAPGDLILQTNTNPLLVQNTGKVGIGTLTPFKSSMLPVLQYWQTIRLFTHVITQTLWWPVPLMRPTGGIL